MISRRQLLELVRTAALAAGALPVLRVLERAARADAGRTRPTFVLQIIPAGGMDAVWGADPKTTRDVQSGIDVPYAENRIVDAKTARLGPAFAPLAPWMPRLAIVNAIRQNSANHVSGLTHTTCCRSGATPGTPALLEILGGRRQREAVGAISIGATFASASSPMYLGQPGTYGFGENPGLFAHLDAADPDDLRVLARTLTRDAAAASRTSPSESRTTDNLRESAALLQAWADTPKLVPAKSTVKWDDYYGNAADLQRAVWLFEHRIARCVTVYIGNQEFDTHLWNHWQPEIITYLATLLAHTFDQLDRTTVEGRSLADQTLVFIGSEIGRFPRLNGAHGKDHFPQAPYLFYGPWWRGGVAYGGTDREMVGLPIDLETGKPEKSGHLLTVDDVGRTILELDGANPEVYGYTGSRMSFLTS